MFSRNRRRNRLSRLNPLARRNRKPAAELARAAFEKPEMLEQLEARQLLFTLTVNQLDPGLNVGTVTAFFGYAIPQLAPSVAPTTGTPQGVTEDFDSDDPAAPVALIPPNFIFDQSNLQLAYTAGQLSVARLIQNGAAQGQNGVEFVMQQGESFGFRVTFGPANTPAAGNFIQYRTPITMNIGGNFDTNAMTVEMRLEGQTVASFTGAQLFALSVPLVGNVRQYTFAAGGQAFDEVRFIASNGPAGPFTVDNVTFTNPGASFAPNVIGRSVVGGAVLVFTGPLGATVTVLDLYGRDMRLTIRNLVPPGSQVQIPLIDPDSDGIPNYNDGIGSITMTGTNQDSALTLWGGTIETFTGAPPANAEFVQGDHALLLAPTVVGQYDQLEDGGFGYSATPVSPGVWNVTGLPPGPGSIVVGAPFVRPLGNYNPAGVAPGGANFSRADQGIFVTGGGSISSVYIHGVLHGTSVFSGFVDRLVVGYMVGSAGVAGDLGYFTSGSDAGMWVDDDGTPYAFTGGTLTVGRTLGEFVTAGRNLMNVVVVGDLNNPSARPARDVLRYSEHEYPAGLLPPTTELGLVRNILANNNFRGTNRFFQEFGIFFNRTDQALAFGTGTVRNDSILAAEWIGSIATAVQINGDLGFQDPVNAADRTDVFAFAADGTQDILIQLDGSLAGGLIADYMRLVDQDGRMLAAPQIATNTDEFIGIRYRPTVPGVYYLVLNSAGGTQDYVLNISGIAPTTFGSYRTGAGSGRNSGVANTVQVLSGSMGAMRVGTAIVNGGGAEIDPGATINVVPTPVDNTDDEADEYMSLRAMTVSVPGTLYTLTTGSDIQDNQGNALLSFTLNVGENLGTIITGLSPIPGTGPTEGDFRKVNLTVGGSIAMFDIRGALGVDQDVTGPIVPDLPDSIIVRTGVNMGTNPSLRGHIGMIRVGSHAGGDTLNLTTPAGSTVGGFLVSQDIATDPTDIRTGIFFSTGTGETLNLGFNSDLRFFDSPRVDLSAFVNHSLPLFPGVAQTVTDDAGGQVTFTIVGGNANAGGLIRVIPISGSLGMAVGRIEVNLDGGAQLQINSLGNPGSTDVISIGRIVVTNATAASSISVGGNTEVDIWRVVQAGGEEFGGISNTTLRGDIVAIDMVAMTNLFVQGDIGRTQVGSWGPQLIGPFLGIDAQGSGEVNGPIQLPNNVIGGGWNGGLYRPVAQANAGTPPSAWLDDIGGPASPYLNGVIVRTGNITTVQAGGSVGDVVANDVTDGNGIILQVIANADIVRLPGHFDGIVGTIYANIIGTVDIGDGLAQKTQSPLPTTGIFANDDIGAITGTRIPGAFISSVIAAANNVVGNAAFGVDGINTITLSGGGSIVDAYISSTTLDSFWVAFFPADGAQYRGTINQVTGTSANFLRSEMVAAVLNNFILNNGFYDASRMAIAGNVQTIVASGYRNSTLFGSELEFYPNEIIIGGNVNLITTFNRTGDIDDLRVDVLGRIFEISGNNMSRTQIDADLELRLIQTVGDLRAVTVTAGLLTQGVIGKNIRSSEILISGPLLSLIVSDSATNTVVDVSGPDGRLELLRVRQLYTGSISVAGPTTTIEVTEGDLIARILTAPNQRGFNGNINLITAGRDIDIDADIAGTVSQFRAGRHIGNRLTPRPIVVHGDIVQISIPNGQLYSDIHIDQGLTGSMVIGAVSNKPGANVIGAGSLFAFGRIENVTITGDFGGRIVAYSGGINFVTINNGSLLKGGAIQAYDGDIAGVIINNGHLFGDIHADYILYLVQLNGGADGIFGDIGINPALSQGNSYDSLRNQLPPGVVADPSIQGPRITAGFNIGRVIVTNGSIFEAFIHAGRAIGTISVAGDIRNDTLTTGLGTVIAAGSSIFIVTATGNITDTIIMAGVRSFGADGRPGGVGANADVIQSGRIGPQGGGTAVSAGGSGANVIITAGMYAGADGAYNTGDESVALGVSFVRDVTFGGSVSGTSVFADSPTLNVSPGVVRGGNTLPLGDPDLSDGSPVIGGELTPGVPFGFNLPGNISGFITFTGPGQAYYDNAARRVILISTDLTSTLVVQATGTLTDFDIVTNDDASMGTITVANGLAGDSDIVVDAYCASIAVGDFSGTGTIKVGMNVRTIVTGNFFGGSIFAPYWVRDIVIGGVFGSTTTTGEARIDATAANSISINGTFAGLVNIERDINAFSVNGAMSFAQFRAGNSVGSFNVGSINQSRVSAGDHIGPIAINGTMHESVIQAGSDLGSDAAPGGTGFAADRASSGNIASVFINGQFTRSSITAGILRGVDGYMGTADDGAAAGRSNIGQVTITGTQVGSNLGSESFRISATGIITGVTLNGQVVSQVGNFKVESLATRSNPLRVQELLINQVSQTWQATLFFNQSIDASTVGPALTISEVRDNGLTLVPLVQGIDYTIIPTEFKDRVLIRFSREVTDRNLVPQGGPPGPGSSTPGAPAPGVPGPGVFRIHLEADVLRATVADARLDTDVSTDTLEDYSQDVVVGDAGDKLLAEVINISATGSTLVDMYGPADLDLVLDNNLTPDGLPDPNLTYIIRGAIGDHPDHGLANFRPTADIDVYKITLRAGQIIRMGALQGPALLVGRFLLNDAGEVQGGVTADTTQLPTDPAAITDLTQPDDYLITTTGTYFIVLANDLSLFDPGVVGDLVPTLSNTGEYNFSLQVFDDFDSGFNAATDSGNGTPVVDAPAAILFAGNDGIFGTPDDVSTIQIGDYIFTRTAGVNGAPDTVTGSNTLGITSIRTGSSLTSIINSAIGPKGHSGVPGLVSSDVDIFHLNNGQAMPAGRTVTIKIKLAELGTDLGTFSRTTGVDFRGDVQFGIFDVTNATSASDGVLIASPTDFKSVAQKAEVLATQGANTYGYDANGDFYITFVTPGPVGGLATDPAEYAIYIQGVFNTDYTIEITQSESAPAASVPQFSQNILLETRGGTVDWLEAGGLVSKLTPFAASVLGFTGTVLSGQNVGDYILQSLVTTLNGIFSSNGLNVVFSTNPAAFEFQEFSTIFLTSSNDPTTIFNTDNFGYSEHADPYNLDHNDEAVLFMPSFAQLGYTPAQADVDNFILSLTGAVGRRAGELMGLRIESNDSPLNDPFSIMAANSAVRSAGQTSNYVYSNTPRALSTGFDSVVNTNFFLGQQNAFALLDKFLTP